MYTTLISVEELQRLQGADAPLMIFDCSFDLMNPAAGEEQYRKAHIPGAVYANLDTDLSDQGVVDPDGTHHPHPDAASGGRHPLPSREKFAMWLSSVGFANDMQAVVYDRNGANYCGRLWWMLKWAGHDAVAVLDGGLQAWQAAGGEVTDREEPSHFQSNFKLARRCARLATTQDVQDRLGQPGQTLDRRARAAALQGRGGAAGPGGRPHPRRPQSTVRRRTSGPTAGSSRRPQLRAEFDQLLAGRDPAYRRASLRQRRQRRAERDRDGTGRAGTHRALCGQLERMVQRPLTAGGKRLSRGA